MPSKLVVLMLSHTARVLLPPSPKTMGTLPPTVSTINCNKAVFSLSVIVAASLVVPSATI